MALCPLQVPLFEEAMAAPVVIFILKFSQKPTKSSERNSPVLALRTLCGTPNELIQFLNKFLIMTYLYFYF